MAVKIIESKMHHFHGRAWLVRYLKFIWKMINMQSTRSVWIRFDPSEKIEIHKGKRWFSSRNRNHLP